MNLQTNNQKIRKAIMATAPKFYNFGAKEQYVI